MPETCSTPKVRNVARVTTSQPAVISWQLHREARPATRRCKNTPLASPHPRRMSAGGRMPAAGRIAGSLDRSDKGYRTRFSLPGRILDGMRPGTYLLTIVAQDQHGTGPTRSRLITITP
jgi:hypothetical protein